KYFDYFQLNFQKFQLSDVALDQDRILLQEGKKLTINGFRGLSKARDNHSVFKEEILRILLNVSNNGQIIPDELIDKLVIIFDPDQVQHHLIEIFENLVENNQNISTELSLKLEETLKNPLICDQVLSIFVLHSQKGNKLSKKIFIKILDIFSNIKNPFIMQEYLSVICSFIQEKENFEQESKNVFGRIFKFFSTSLISRIQTALIYTLKKGNQNVIHTSLSGFKTLISLHKVKLEKKSIEALLSLATKVICDGNIKEEINMILDVSKLDENQKCILKLCNLKYNSNEQLLDRLIEFDKPKLLEQNFDQINFIIDNCPELNSKALETLLKCSNKEDIPDKLLDSIGVLLASSISSTIISSCCRLLAETAKTGRKFTNEIISIVAAAQDEKEGSIHILELISKNQLISKELQDRIHLFSQIDRMMNMNPTSLGEFLNRIRQELHEGLKLSNQLIEKILSIKIPTNNNNQNFEQDLIDIFALVLIQNPSYYSSQPSIVDSLEKAILSKKINKIILNVYQEVIKVKQCQTNNFPNVLNVFIDILDQNEKYIEFHFDILVCIVLAFEIIGISKLEPLESRLFSNDEIIRSWSFRGLRAAYENGYESVIFQEWCNNIIDNLEKDIGTKVDRDLDLFETIAALKYVDFTKIRGKSQNQWNRELLIFDLIERFKVNEEERFHFYKTWLKIEEHEEFEKGQSDILLKLLHRILLNNTMPFNQCYDAIKILDTIDFEDARHVLSYSRNPCLDLQKKCLGKSIYQRLLNKKDVNSKYIDNLASNMISKFGLDVSHKLFDAIKNIDSLREFENILNFAEKNNIKISDIYVKETTISILKRSLEIKFLGNQIKKADRRKLAVHLDNLLDKSWTFEQLNVIFSNLVVASNSVENVKERNFVYVLEILSQYKIPPTRKKSRKSFPSSSGTDRELASRIFDNSEQYKSYPKSQHWSIYIAQWTQDQIRLWANIVKMNAHTCTNTENLIIESLAVIKQANYLDTGFHLTDTQILSCLVALNPKSDKGKLLQVETGEGKSTIISVLAVIHALKGENVDIITSSPILAERDSKEKAKFYRMFELQCRDNNDKSLLSSRLH
ncbi:unnamed protein product, partial [Didymodactylos carnosus]